MNTWNNTKLHPTVFLCRRIAAEAHTGQTRRNGWEPYINHPAEVARRLEGAPVVILSTAWLHDVLEDTKLTAADLAAKGVPEGVIEAVEAMTKRPGEEYREYLRRVTRHPVAHVVKRVDMLANLNDNPSPRDIRKYCEGLLYLTAP